MRKTYQNQDVDTSLPALPDTVNLAVAELAGELREGLLALAVGTGMQVLAALMEEDVTAACGPKGRHDPQRRATRHGHERGSVTLGGRRVPVQRPRMRAADGCGELPVPTYELFSRVCRLTAESRPAGSWPSASSRSARACLTRSCLGPVQSSPAGLWCLSTYSTSACRTMSDTVSRRFVAMCCAASHSSSSIRTVC